VVVAEVVVESLVGYDASAWSAQQVTMVWQIGDDIRNFGFCRLFMVSE
jgi:hypothetical protein